MFISYLLLRTRIVLPALTILIFGLPGFSQEALNPDKSEQQDIDFVEKMFDTRSATFREQAPSRNAPSQQKQTAEYVAVESEAFSADIATIQKNYMPKTSRVLLSGGLSLLPSDVFYRTVGVNLKASYHFTETWGVEAFGYLMTSQARDEVNELSSVQNLAVRNLVSVNSFYGLNAYFNSIYGKVSFLNWRIIPFEIYQTIGLGKVRTGSGYESSSIQIGIGDIFSLSRSTVLRLDLTWAFYKAQNYLNEEQNANSLFLTVSYGRLFPEPTYR